MAGSESARAAGIAFAHAVRDIAKDEVSAELQRRLGGLTEKERRILDMWPRFENGELVMLGDAFMQHCGVNDVVERFDFEDANVHLWGESGYDCDLGVEPVIARPVQSVLDADGMEIKVGDTVWFDDKPTAYTVAGFAENGTIMLSYESREGTEITATTLAYKLTHTRPDSWERLEEDAVKDVCSYFRHGDGGCDGCPMHERGVSMKSCFNGMRLDLIRRAKKLAGNGGE